MWICLLTASCIRTEQNRQVITKQARCSHYRAKMSGDVLARKRRVLVAMGADVERVVPREKTHAMYWRSFGEVSPTFYRIFGDASEKIQGKIGAIYRPASACDRQIYRRCVGGVMVMSWRCRGDVLKTPWRWYSALWRTYERWRDFTRNRIARPTLWLPNEIMDKEEINFVQLSYYWVQIENRVNKRKHRHSIADASQSSSETSWWIP